MSSTISSLQELQSYVDQEIPNHIPLIGPESPLRDACGYALLNGGKRLRPIITLLIAKGLNQGLNPIKSALAVEFFHTASLVADDLPCMDDDDERRGKPATHKVFGEPGALLVTYALIAAGYEFISLNAKEMGRSDLAHLALENATFNTGLNGATGGQYLDVYPSDLSLNGIREVIHKKTTSLFEISFVFGWLFGGGDPKELDKVKKAASHFGFAFQIADDISDSEQDLQNGRKINVANLLGIEDAKNLFHVEQNLFFDEMIALGIEMPSMIPSP